MQLRSLHNKFKTGYKHEITRWFNQYKHTSDVIAGPSTCLRLFRAARAVEPFLSQSARILRHV